MDSLINMSVDFGTRAAAEGDNTEINDDDEIEKLTMIIDIIGKNL